jgi:ubiquinone/menaquinone biosynthesis C-methylase UbiE
MSRPDHAHGHSAIVLDPSERMLATYYEKTASAYNSMHLEDQEHNRALDYMLMLANARGFDTFLDVGAGTGRGVRFLHERGKHVRGVEPVGALIKEGELNGLPQGLLVEGSGYELPFEDESFDVVFECGVLHHVREPNRVVKEMIRVAKCAIFISDSNRFGQGNPAARMLKLGLHKCHLWRAVRFLQTRGKMYTVSEGDGLTYSYSVYDSYDQLAVSTQEIWLLPTATDKSGQNSWAHPLLTSSHALLCAFKDLTGSRTMRTGSI